jgi:hypothetical protein
MISADRIAAGAALVSDPQSAIPTAQDVTQITGV